MSGLCYNRNNNRSKNDGNHLRPHVGRRARRACAARGVQRSTRRRKLHILRGQAHVACGARSVKTHWGNFPHGSFHVFALSFRRQAHALQTGIRHGALVHSCPKPRTEMFPQRFGASGIRNDCATCCIARRRRYVESECGRTGSGGVVTFKTFRSCGAA